VKSLRRLFSSVVPAFLQEPRTETAGLLIVFTRYPEPGTTKTRLVSTLGEEGAATLQAAMTRHVLELARQLNRAQHIQVEVRYEGGNKDLMTLSFGPDLRYRHQGSGSLGERIKRAFDESFQIGYQRIVIIGSDCPEISVDLLNTSFTHLEKNDLVLGPATDGGYYLVGLHSMFPGLFDKIPWGTDHVFQRTFEIAQRLRMQVFILPCLCDVDRPEDLNVWEKVLQSKTSPKISVIIPTLNEAETILTTIMSANSAPEVELIVADGGSTDGTADIAAKAGTRVLVTSPGRARQMNAGAAVATGDVLLFLHADTTLPQGFDTYVRETLKENTVVAGAFEFKAIPSLPGMNIIERLANWRSRRLQLPYGDQGIFVRAELFRKLGGFPEVQIMEDFELIRRIRRYGRVATANIPVLTSSRKWKARGVLSTTLLNQVIILGHLIGVPPEHLSTWYNRNRD